MSAATSYGISVVRVRGVVKDRETECCSYLPFSFLWLFMVVPKTIAAALYAVMLVWLVANRKSAKRPSEQFKILFALILASIFVYLISISHAMFIDFDPGRLVAAFGTFLSWMLGLGYAFYYSTCKDVSWQAISKRMAINMFVMTGFLLAYYVGSSLLPSIFGRQISSIDYLALETTTRFNAFMEYPTLVAMFFLLSYGAAVYWVNMKAKTVGVALLSVFGVLSLQAAASRAGFFAGIVVAIAGLLYSVYSSNRKIEYYFIPLALLFALAAAMILLVYGPAIANEASEIVSSRSGSTSGRLYIYSESISMTLSNSPLIGMGVKYASSLSNDAPFGSHSTWIGLFYKTGFIGLVLYGVVFYQMLRMQLGRVSKGRSYEKLLVTCLLVLYLYFCVEDLDGTAWVCVLFFSLFSARINCSEARRAGVQGD